MPIIERDRLNTKISELKQKHGGDRSALLPILQDLQEEYGCLTGLIMQETAHALDVHPTEVEGVVSFYSFFRTEEQQGKFVIRLCRTISCDLAGKERVANQFRNELGVDFGETTPDGMFTLEYTNCLGMCDQGPAVLINDRLFAKVTPDMVPQLIEECRRDFLKSEFPQAVPSVVCKAGPIIQSDVSPGDSLKAALGQTRADVIAGLRESGLKGRGGAGFPTAVKWQLAAAAKSNAKYVVCNADEGEPGTFKDRFLLFDRTDLVLTGMIIGGYAIGAKKGYIYLRGEYLYLKKHLEETLARFRQEGRLGETILGKEGFDFDIELRMGAGAYICGEETALIESLEGFRGEPRNRPPFPVDTGFMKHPSIVNNVETFVAAALISAKGAEWFKAHGTEKSTGTKLFSVSGDCERPGIYELPFGVTIAELLREVGAVDTKAVQIGGASGHCVPSSEFDRAIAFEDIPSGGSIIIFNRGRDMLEVAKNFMEFFVEESCGQCTPCRDGNVTLLEGLEMLEQGCCPASYLQELTKLGETMQIASKCGLGQSSPNAFLSIVKHFKNELLGRAPKTS
jgi:[NiFe] hydrogenase diaphorase moiety large subunit